MDIYNEYEHLGIPEESPFDEQIENVNKKKIF